MSYTTVTGDRFTWHITGSLEKCPNPSGKVKPPKLDISIILLFKK